MRACNFLTRQNFLIVSGTTALLSLIYAFYAQQFENINPCILCLYERYFYAGIVLCGVMGSFKKLVSLSYKLSSIVLICGLALAIYHLGVENHWWQGTAACHGVTNSAKTIEELRASLKAKPMGRCDQAHWYVFGISATYLNFIWFMGFLSLWEIVRRTNRC